MHRIVLALLAVLASTIALWACGGGGGKAVGTEGAACYGNHTCNAGLACLSDLCVNPLWSGPDASGNPVGGDGGTLVAGDGGTLPDGSDAGSVVQRGGDAGTKLMLVVDKSGSMKMLASSDTAWGCANDGLGNGYDPSGDCKWNTLKDLLTKTGGFLDQMPSARVGMALFSDPNTTDSCATGVVEVPVPAAAGASVASIKNKLAGYTPAGGTPSAATLQNLSNDPSLTSSEPTRNYLLLVTDGMPNCNASMSPSSCTACTNAGDPSKSCGDLRNCLDSVALVDAVKALKAKGIDTFVVGFGNAFSNADARKVLDDAAAAGGQAQQGQATLFYLATDAASLQAALDLVRAKL